MLTDYVNMEHMKNAIILQFISKYALKIRLLQSYEVNWIYEFDAISNM